LIKGVHAHTVYCMYKESQVCAGVHTALIANNRQRGGFGALALLEGRLRVVAPATFSIELSQD
jgi:hypothetical protein